MGPCGRMGAWAHMGALAPELMGPVCLKSGHWIVIYCLAIVASSSPQAPRPPHGLSFENFNKVDQESGCGERGRDGGDGDGKRILRPSPSLCIFASLLFRREQSCRVCKVWLFEIVERAESSGSNSRPRESFSSSSSLVRDVAQSASIFSKAMFDARLVMSGFAAFASFIFKRAMMLNA